MKRPLYVVGMSFGIALLAATALGFHMAFIAAVLAAFLSVLLFTVRKVRRHEGVAAGLVAVCMAFSLFAGWDYLIVQPLQRMDSQTVDLTLWIEKSVGESARSLTYYARVRGGELPEDTRLLVRVENGENAPQLYDVVHAAVRLESTDEWRSENIFLTARIRDCEVTVSQERPWDLALLNGRTRIIGRLETKADGDVAALLRTVCFGDKTKLSDTVKDNFAAAGLSHITAVSGFHMSIVSLGLFKLLQLLGLRRRVAALLALPIPPLFAAFTGFAFSAMRAGVMACIMLAAALFRREADARNSLGAAVLCLLLLDVTAVYDLGFQLSVAATWGILWVSGLQPKESPRGWRKITYGLRLTVAAVAATLPFTAGYFGEVSLLSPITNLIGQPLASVIVSAGCIGTLLLSVPFLSFAGTPLILIAGIAARGLLWISELAASLPFAFLRLDEPHLVVWAIAVPFALLLGWQFLKKRGVRMAAMCLVIVFCASSLVYHFGMRGVTTLSSINVTDGAVTILERDGHYAAVVMGEPPLSQVQRVLVKQGVDHLDVVIYADEETAAVCQAVSTENNILPAAEERSAAVVSVTLWEDTVITWQDGWCRLVLGERTVLISSPNKTVGALPPAWRRADLAVFDRQPPDNLNMLALGEAILCCSEEELPDVTDEMVWGVYPVSVTADETVTVKLR